MFFLLILLSLIAGLLLISKDTFFYSLAIIGVLVVLSLRKYKLKKKIIIFLILSFIGGILFSIIKLPLINKNLFLIIEKHENYLIGFNGINKVYLYSNPNTDLSHKFLSFRNFCVALNGIQHECDDFKFDNY